MKKLVNSRNTIIFFSIMTAVIFFRGLQKVPFHPDETSILYQSRDLELLISDPISLAWKPRVNQNQDLTYRLLNPPIPKYIVGIGRLLAGYQSEAVDVDWDWSASWEENLASSALPELDLLLGSRSATTLILLSSLIPSILITKKLSGIRLTLIAIPIFAVHSLLLLHGRRAMSEGPLIFGVMLAILGLLEAENRPWLTGLGTAIAIGCKLSAAALLPIGMIAVLWRDNTNSHVSLGSQSRRLFVFGIVLVGVTLILNPVLWLHPLAGIEAIWHARVDFAFQQVETIRGVSPELVLEKPSQRVAAMLVMPFFRAPQTSEVANYSADTLDAEQTYLSDPINVLTNGFPQGGIVLFFVILGIALSLSQLKGMARNTRREILLLLFGTAAQALAILIAIPIPFQRYYIPLLPFIIIWMSLGVIKAPQLIKKAAQRLDGLTTRLR